MVEEEERIIETEECESQDGERLPNRECGTTTPDSELD